MVWNLHSGFFDHIKLAVSYLKNRINMKKNYSYSELQKMEADIDSHLSKVGISKLEINWIYLILTISSLSKRNHDILRYIHEDWEQNIILC